MRCGRCIDVCPEHIVPQMMMAAAERNDLELFEKYNPRLVILDIMLPGIDGFAICSRIRQKSNTPIIIVSARTAKEDKLAGLSYGADDYIEKPYDIDILLAKISGIFKRRCAMDEIADGALRINRISRTVYKDSLPLAMTAKEFDLLLLLMENKGRALKKEYIFNQVWGADSFSEPQTLTVHIKWLREKIEADPGHPQIIRTIWGVGYQYI